METTTRHKPLFNKQPSTSLITLFRTIIWEPHSIDKVSLKRRHGHFRLRYRRTTRQTESTLNLAHVYYNLGNAQFKTGDLAAAVESYRHTLRLVPQDIDAQHNLALALQLAKQQEDLAQQQANKNAPPKTEPDDIGKSEALRLLERFSENENRLRQKLLQQQRKSGYRREKDW